MPADLFFRARIAEPNTAIVRVDDVKIVLHGFEASELLRVEHRTDLVVELGAALLHHDHALGGDERRAVD